LNIKLLAFKNNDLEVITKNAFRGVLSVSSLAIFDEIKQIEVDSLFHIRDKIDELEISSSGITNQIFDSFITEIRILANLKSLTLSFNLITSLNKEWLKYFSNLQKLGLNGNSLSDLDEDVFDANQKLNTLTLSNNKFNDLSIVTRALASINNTLVSLFLSGNSFKSIEMNSFQNFAKLKALFLSNNLIEKIDDNSFENNKELNWLSLDGNFLKQIPNLKNLTKLYGLSMNNQNERLTELVDYAFERNRYANILNLDINSNKLVKFGNKTFCDRNSLRNIFGKITIDYDSIKLIDKCLLKQLSLFTSKDYPINIDVAPSTESSNYSEVCNCDLKVFLSKFYINLIGVCSQVNLTCSNSQVADDCIDKSEYFCDNPNLSTTTETSTMSKTSLITTTTSSGLRLKQSYLFSSSLILLITTLLVILII
jgi:hypothetical protein